jgi:hypothetical protein
VIVRSTAHLLVLVMLLASGRLLACGLECLDERAVPDQASCHQESTPATSLSADASHACLPDIVEPRVTGTKPVTVHAVVSPLMLVSTLVARHSPPVPLRSPVNVVRHRFEASHSSAPFVLRI